MWCSGRDALAGGMPLYKYIANRFLTAIQNLLMGAKLSEYHTGYRAFSREVLETLPLLENSDDFVFDNQMLAQILLAGFKIGEVSCPTAYFVDALLHRKRLARIRYFDPNGERLDPSTPPQSEESAPPATG